MWEIDHQCPQCSAPVTLLETERFFVCPYCKVRLFISSEQTTAYYLTPANDDPETLFIPYRRNRGIGFAGTEAGVTGSVIDRTTLACPLPFLPRSLGVRPQAMRLRFFRKEQEGRSVLPSVAADDRMTASRQAVVPGRPEENIPESISIWRYLGETESYVYSPLKVLGRDVYDGVTMDLLGRTGTANPFEATPFHTPSNHVAFIPALCPNCGGDLSGEKESVALPCPNCGVLWEASGSRLTERPFLRIPAPDGQQAWFLPFWRVRARAEGVGLPLFIDPLKDNPHNYGSRRPILFPHFFFWIPAFTINPSLFLRLCDRATVWQPTDDLVADQERNDDHWVYPVTLPAAEAERLLLVVLSLIIAERQRTLRRLVGTTVEPTERTLVFVPFLKAGSEVIHSGMHVSLQLNALRHGMSL